MKFDPLPVPCLVDQTLEIRLRGAAAGEPVVVRLCSRFNVAVLLSEATFRADDQGVVDLCRDAPVAGSYAGVDAMGLFWSRAPISAERAASLPAEGRGGTGQSWRAIGQGCARIPGGVCAGSTRGRRRVACAGRATAGARAG